MQKPLLISCTGLASSGKNTFCDLIQKQLKDEFGTDVLQLSFAEQLRNDVGPFLQEKFDFDVWNNKDKDKFRPLLVWFGNLKRSQTFGRYFIDKVKDKFDIYKNAESLLGKRGIATISDLRFEDELEYCKSEGVVVHISKYKLPDPERPDIKWFDFPPNEFEAKNDPILKQASDYQVCWEHQENGDLSSLNVYVEAFVKWLIQEKHLLC
jgi:hypothetical protein